MWRSLALAAGSGCAFIFVAGCLWTPGGSFSPRLYVEESLVFWPIPYPVGNWTRAAGVEDAWFQSSDGTRLHGWYAPANEPRAVVLFAHGNAGNVTCLRQVLEVFHDRMNTSILVFDYRGYGRSGGSPTDPRMEAGIVADARAARQWLANRAGIPEQDIVLTGHSLGGGVVVNLAAQDGARGLVLVNTFTSLTDAEASHVPLRPLLQLHLDSLATISKYKGPLLQTHGDADTVIPFEFGQKLFSAANEPKQFIPVPGGGHNDLLSPVFITALDHFLDALPPTAAKKSP